MDLAGITVPSINKNAISCLGLDEFRVLDGLPWQLWEGLTEDHSSSFLSPEAILLAVGCVPDPVDEKVRYVERRQSNWIHFVSSWVMVGKVNSAVAVAEWHSS